MKITACIPARYQSQRLPGKPLLPLAGKPMIQWVYEAVATFPDIQETYVLTDDERILQWGKDTSIPVLLTSDRPRNGTERIGEVLNDIDADVILNIQGDEPIIETEKLSAITSLFLRPEVDIATLAAPITDSDFIHDYNKVKVVKSRNSRAMYFSRQAIPAVRDEPYRKWVEHASYLLHIGMYGFRKETLKEILLLPESPVEKSEKLEQLRWLENDYDIYVATVKADESYGVDTPEDYKAMKKYFKKLYNK